MTSRTDAGSYRYLLNGEETGIGEQWARRELPSGEVRVITSRRAPGVVIEVVAGTRNGLVTEFEVSWTDTAGVPIRASYGLREGEMWTTRSSGAEPALQERVDCPGEHLPLLFPLMRIFAGPLIGQLLQWGGQGTVVLPYIGDPTARERLLRPQLSVRQARVLDPAEEVDLGDRVVLCRRCEYLGDQYDATARFWLAPDDTLVRYTLRQSSSQNWDVRLAPR